MTTDKPKELVALNELAEKINTSYKESLDSAKHAILKAKETGDYLIQAKKLVQHGEWSDFLQKNTAVSVRQSQKYMRLSKNWNEIESKTNHGALLSINQALELIADSKPEIDTIADSIRERIGRVKSFLGESIRVNEAKEMNGKLVPGNETSITLKELIEKILSKKAIGVDMEAQNELSGMDQDILKSILSCADLRA